MTNTGTKVAAAVIGAGALYTANKKYAFTHDLSTLIKIAPAVIDEFKRIGSHITTADIFEMTVDTYQKKTAILFEGKKYSFIDIDNYANQVANWGLSIGLAPGDKVALFVENRPEFVFLWIGLCKIGVVSAFINFNLKSTSLVHSINVAHAKVLIFGSELSHSVNEISNQMQEKSVRMFMLLDEATTANHQLPSYAQSLDEGLKQSSNVRPPASIRKNIGYDDLAVMIYTSGTTGLPKAAAVRHARVTIPGKIMAKLAGITPHDRIYCVLPLYHSSGGSIGIGMMMTVGTTVVIRRKFSLSAFWDDVRKYNCTVIQYIGELCRYLVSAPPHPKDRQNQVRIALGNGLRPEIWDEFQDRFGIPEIGEFYAATEGNTVLFNHCTTREQRGNLGKTGLLQSLITGAKLVKYNVAEDEHIKGPDGFLIPCKFGEIGELIGPIDQKHPSKRFDGYYGNPEATNKKILRDVFKKGDVYFRTGDLLKQDQERRWYFVDRIGDTFRWKGENVSTTEVAEVLSVFPGIKEANVYGVQLPGKDGRACMAAIIHDSADFNGLAAHVKKHLAQYAIPLFLRELPEMDITGTFKHQKMRLQKEGVDVSKVSDPIWYFDYATTTYKRLTPDNYHHVVVESKL